MANTATIQDPAKQLHLTVEGHQVTISFATEHNSSVSQLIRNALLDDYLTRTGVRHPSETA